MRVQRDVEYWDEQLYDDAGDVDAAPQATAQSSTSGSTWLSMSSVHTRPNGRSASCRTIRTAMYPRGCMSSSRTPITRLCFFFFQAEDGIRDYKVTGVQTCALPISLRELNVHLDVTDRRVNWSEDAVPKLDANDAVVVLRESTPCISNRVGRSVVHSRRPEIGRASCRERV